MHQEEHINIINETYSFNTILSSYVYVEDKMRFSSPLRQWEPVMMLFCGGAELVQSSYYIIAPLVLIIVFIVLTLTKNDFNCIPFHT